MHAPFHWVTIVTCLTSGSSEQTCLIFSGAIMNMLHSDWRFSNNWSSSLFCDKIRYLLLWFVHVYSTDRQTDSYLLSYYISWINTTAKITILFWQDCFWKFLQAKFVKIHSVNKNRYGTYLRHACKTHLITTIIGNYQFDSFGSLKLIQYRYAHSTATQDMENYFHRSLLMRSGVLPW